MWVVEAQKPGINVGKSDWSHYTQDGMEIPWIQQITSAPDRTTGNFNFFRGLVRTRTEAFQLTRQTISVKNMHMTSIKGQAGKWLAIIILEMAWSSSTGSWYHRQGLDNQKSSGDMMMMADHHCHKKLSWWRVVGDQWPRLHSDHHDHY